MQILLLHVWSHFKQLEHCSLRECLQLDIAARDLPSPYYLIEIILEAWSLMLRLPARMLFILMVGCCAHLFPEDQADTCSLEATKEHADDMLAASITADRGWHGLEAKCSVFVTSPVPVSCPSALLLQKPFRTKQQKRDARLLLPDCYTEVLCFFKCGVIPVRSELQ